MPITGTEAVLKQLLHDNIKAEMQGAGLGASLRDDWLLAFCKGVAESIIPHLVANVTVNTAGIVTSSVPGAGLLDSLSGAVTGTAIGTDTVDTTIS